MLIRDDFYQGRIFTLNYKKEPNYLELNIAHFRGEEDRKLLFIPFPTFKEKPKFRIIKECSEEVFYKNCKLFYIREYDSYLNNFSNIVGRKKSLLDGGVSLMSDRFMTIPPDMIYPNTNNPRKTFDDESMAELEDSVKKHGVLHV